MYQYLYFWIRQFACMIFIYTKHPGLHFLLIYPCSGITTSVLALPGEESQGEGAATFPFPIVDRRGAASPQGPGGVPHHHQATGTTSEKKQPLGPSLQVGFCVTTIGWRLDSPRTREHKVISKKKMALCELPVPQEQSAHPCWCLSFPSSGGVGQMGMLIALDTLLQQLKGEKSVDVYGVVLRLVRSCCLMTPTLVCKGQEGLMSSNKGT